MTTFAERLKNAMEQANMSQSALSEQAGASKAAISQYLSGKNTPGPDRIKALADATGVSFDYLMGYGAAPVAEPPIKKISVKEAARCMGKSDQFVRIGLQRGLLPFGNAVPGTGACWNYYINPTKFRDYVGADQFNSFFGLIKADLNATFGVANHTRRSRQTGLPQIKKVIYSGPKTIILWADNTKTIVSCGEADSYDYYSGFCAAVVKKLFGSTTHAKKVLGASIQIND